MGDPLRDPQQVQKSTQGVELIQTILSYARTPTASLIYKRGAGQAENTTYNKTQQP